MSIRFLRVEDPDLWAAREDVPRDERLRELVDALPEREKHMIERTFFGGATLTLASAELGLSRSTGARILREGMQRLEEWLRDGYVPEERPVPELPEHGYPRDTRRGYELLSDSEAEALINGRYRGDGRRIDQYTTHDPLGWYPE